MAMKMKMMMSCASAMQHRHSGPAERLWLPSSRSDLPAATLEVKTTTTPALTPPELYPTTTTTCVRNLVPGVGVFGCCALRFYYYWTRDQQVNVLLPDEQPVKLID
jgi:hypothetical protein